MNAAAPPQRRCRRAASWWAALGLWALASATGHGQVILPGPDPHIRRVILDENVTHLVPAWPKITTSVLFPYALEDVSGVGFSKDPTRTRGDFYVKVEPRSPKLDVTPIDDPRVRTTPMVAGEGRNLNVMAGGKVYVLFFFLAESRDQALTKLVFVRAEDLLTERRAHQIEPAVATATPAASPAVPVSRSLTLPPRPFSPAGDARIMGVLDTIKLLSGTYGETRRQLLERMPQIQLSDRTERDAGNPGLLAQDTADYDDFSVRLERVIRNNKIDALGFEVVITNKTGRTLYFDPESFGVRVGENVYEQVTADPCPALAPHGEMEAWFEIITSPSGAPNYLAPDNDFSVLLTQTDGRGRDIGGARRRRRPVPSQPEGKEIVVPR